ncbi:hypothetical protein C8R47DRAFT_1111958 [Mycena vitilis]|nr:hypothetical protein C8R47DRAFT_1111958 [Mycena vitilis]
MSRPYHLAESIEVQLLRKAQRQARTTQFRQQTLIEKSTHISQVLLQQHRMRKLDSLVGDVHRNAQSFRQRGVGAGEGDVAPYQAALDRIKAEKVALDKASDRRAGGTIGVWREKTRLITAQPAKRYGRPTPEDEVVLPRSGRAIREIEDEGGRVASGREHGGHSRRKAENVNDQHSDIRSAHLPDVSSK